MNLLQWLGMKSKCCNAGMEFVFGAAYNGEGDGKHCSKCGKIV